MINVNKYKKKTKKFMEKHINFRNNYLIGLIIFSMIFLMIYSSYALFIVSKTKEGAYNITTGTIKVAVASDALDENSQVTVSNGETKEFNITLTNETSVPAKVIVYYEMVEPATKPADVNIGYKAETPVPNNNGVVLNKSGTEGDSVTYTLVVENNTTQDITIIVSTEEGLNNTSLTVKDNAIVITEPIVINNDYDEIKGVNKPRLAPGMTPIKWDGTTWVNTTESDDTWYNYTTTDKKWANAKTADGSMWVWIPRYIYKISSGWHTKTTGTIDIQFSKNTDDNWNNAVIGNIDTGTTAAASNNKWTNHPGFTFGSTELSGLWVAKFEASGTTSGINILPNVVALKGINISNIFTACRNMETNSRYGWDITGTGIDTHLMKNVEWGVVAYLTKSTYGKTSEVWINPSSKYLTGQAGTSVSDGGTTTTNAYNTTNGVNASTTGNIYGVYDMSGGAWEYTAAYINNGNSVLTTNGSILIAVETDIKYKDVYTVGTGDTRQTNYNAAISKKGDAIYEVSSTYEANNGWYGDYSNTPLTSEPFFYRGGNYEWTTMAGMFTFNAVSGGANNTCGFRPIITIDKGL